ncbi:Uncharacterised protein [Serratia plymuthica]|nr:Uncharacterised protein [Serratia plymuthica]VEI15704.1 Uncharacterised protein [Serratia plymuthica]
MSIYNFMSLVVVFILIAISAFSFFMHFRLSKKKMLGFHFSKKGSFRR